MLNAPLKQAEFFKPAVFFKQAEFFNQAELRYDDGIAKPLLGGLRGKSCFCNNFTGKQKAIVADSGKTVWNDSSLTVEIGSFVDFSLLERFFIELGQWEKNNLPK